MMELINNKVPAASLPAEKRQIQIHNLPEELLDVILQYVKTSASTGQFWDCFRTCRQWHRIGLGVHGNLELSMLAILESGTRRHKMMQEDPEMNIKIVTNFAIHLPSRLCLSVLRALTVYVMNARIASPFNPNKKDFFGSLADTFKTTKKLSSFSLKFADDGWDFPFTDVPAISETQLARLVSALPSTVINLEIDTAGADLPRSEEMLKVNPDNYLCYLIGKIFPRLQHVRLRAAHVCQALLESGLNFDPSCCTKAYCGVRRHIQSCQITFSWALRTLSVWMPIKEDERSSSFIQAAKVLTEHCACHSPIIRATSALKNKLLAFQVIATAPDRSLSGKLFHTASTELSYAVLEGTFNLGNVIHTPISHNGHWSINIAGYKMGL
ncbi:hypothetical protein CC78DRAFT_549544 [Lojkania enalia]|uniref:F-box domain-containing protein n=1 Tax=Lojkania enalia TaxID=147567 RepID=A0A9P4MUJ0_9PLEO|nr:hypothetical protein CC78DRAFT_549544 [Didymosphaeria enalia]